jgi:hypothetical protein
VRWDVSPAAAKDGAEERRITCPALTVSRRPPSGQAFCDELREEVSDPSDCEGGESAAAACQVLGASGRQAERL